MIESITNNPFNISFETQTDKIIEENKRDIEKLKEKAGLKKLPEELIEKSWKLNEDNESEILIPYSNNIFWCCGVNPEIIEDKRKKKWVISWKYSTEKETYSIGEEFYSNIFINRTNPKGDKEIGNRNKVMVFMAEEYELPRGFEKIREYWDSQINLLNRHKIEQLLLDNFEKQDNIENLEENEEVKRYEYEIFEDYPEPIKKEAVEIIKKGKLLDYLKYSTSITHEGDEYQALNDFRSNASLFLGKPVHKFNNGGTGVGKSHLENETLAHIPNQYVHRFRTVSAKFIYYDIENFHPKYNIFSFDDFKETEDNIEVGKELSDNEKKVKELKTVTTDRESKTYTIPGHVLTRFNSAKQISDVEFLNRFFLDNISDKDDHQKDVKNKTKNNEICHIADSFILNNGRLTLKCAFQHLIDKDMKVFNPYSLFLDVENMNNRNIKGYLTYILANSFFDYYNRREIKGIVIGNFKDFSDIANNVENQAIKQNYKLSQLQEDIIKLIPIYGDGKIKEIKAEAVEDLEEAKKYAYTYDRLAKLLKRSKSSIINAINGIKGGTNPSLIDLGLIHKTEFNIDSHRKDVFLYKSEDSYNVLNDDDNTNHIVYFENKLSFDTLDKKIGLIINYINSLNILINTQLKYNIAIFCENHLKPLNSYESICNFLEQFIEANENDLIKIDNSVVIDFESMKFHFDELKRYQKRDIYYCSMPETKKK